MENLLQYLFPAFSGQVMSREQTDIGTLQDIKRNKLHSYSANSIKTSSKRNQHRST